MDWFDNIHTNTFHLVKKIVKIGPVDPKIALLNFKKRKKLQKVKYIARSAGFLSIFSKQNVQVFTANFQLASVW